MGSEEAQKRSGRERGSALETLILEQKLQE